MYSRCRTYHFVKRPPSPPGRHRFAKPGGAFPPGGQSRPALLAEPPGSTDPPAGVRGPAMLEVARLLERHEVFGRQLLASLETLEDHLRFPLRVDLDGRLGGHAAALHPDPVDELVVVVHLADVLDVLAVHLVREHLRLDEILLRVIRLP